VASVDATHIARETIGVPITNTAMIGAFLKVSPIIPLEAMKEHLEERFGSRAAQNFKAMQRAYDELVVEGATR
ncbi:MAG: 2-oxoacid:acceptor oxidoreductase family protein, partial [Dehalococcoidia bacterium]|nr:2-oxoacid:acceptor oxidoreductase family protein [Dehalococcoidia bacterium]